MDSQHTAKAATLQIASIEIDGLSGLCCRNCGGPLDVCQPDPNLPDRFLATCPDCLTWYHVESAEDQTTVWIASLAPLAGQAHAWDYRPSKR